MDPVRIKLRTKYLQASGSGHKSTHNTGRIAPRLKGKHSYWTDPGQYGKTLLDKKPIPHSPVPVVVYTVNEKGGYTAHKEYRDGT